MKAIDWSKVSPAMEGERLPVGGYLVQILRATDVPQKEYLLVEYDIVCGEYKGHFRKLHNSFGKWNGKLYRSYKEKAQGMFKSFLDAVEGSNDGYKFNNNENTLVGKFLGLVMGEEEYFDDYGRPRTSIKPMQCKTVEAIRAGNFKVPEPKRLSPEKIAEVSNLSTDTLPDFEDEELPF